MPHPPLPTEPVALPPGGLRALLRAMGQPDEFGNPPPSLTGCLVLDDRERQRVGKVYFRFGRVYAVEFTGFTFPVATRLHSGGQVTEEQRAYLAALPPEQVGPSAVALGYAPADVVEDIHRQMVLSSLVHLFEWDAPWRWSEGEETTDFTISGLEVNLIVAAADERMGQWNALERNFPQVTKSSAVPQRGPEAEGSEDITPEMAMILRHADGRTSIARIATLGGFTRFEISARLAKAIVDGLLVIPDPGGQAADRSASARREQELRDAALAVEQAQQRLAEAQQRLASLQAQ